jgi:two-component system, LuxR family, response regulator FixJ
MGRCVVLVERDPAVRNALAFSLSLEGFDVRMAASAEAVDLRDLDPEASCLVVGHEPGAADLPAALALLTDKGAALPAVVLATNPNRMLRERLAAAGARLVEKPLIGDALSNTLRTLHPSQQAA